MYIKLKNISVVKLLLNIEYRSHIIMLYNYMTSI